MPIDVQLAVDSPGPDEAELCRAAEAVLAHMNDSVETGGFVEASSGLLLLFAAGAIVGPLIASTVMRFVGPEGLFFHTSAVHVLMAAFAVYRMRKHARPPEDQREPFVDSIRVAQTVATIDPLAKPEQNESAERERSAP